MMALQKEKNPLVENFATDIVVKKTKAVAKIKNYFEASLPDFTTEDLATADSKKPTMQTDEGELKVFATHDKDLLQKYYKLRHESYTNEFHFPNYNGFENKYDTAGRIIVATLDGEVIGGMRMMFCTDRNFLSADIENTNFTYQNLFQQMKIENPIYCEISAIVVSKNNRGHNILEKMFEIALNHYIESKCQFLVGVSTAVHCRVYRMIFKKLGHSSVVKLDFPWMVREDHNSLQEFPIVVSIF